MEGMMKLLRVAFGGIEYRKDLMFDHPRRGLEKHDVVSWTGERESAYKLNYLRVIHPEVGLIWVHESLLDGAF
jgi:hypothetical protein